MRNVKLVRRARNGFGRKFITSSVTRETADIVSNVYSVLSNVIYIFFFCIFYKLFLLLFFFFRLRKRVHVLFIVTAGRPPSFFPTYCRSECAEPQNNNNKYRVERKTNPIETHRYGIEIAFFFFFLRYVETININLYGNGSIENQLLRVMFVKFTDRTTISR